ncbi:MerR family transcriptional regulator [Loigolactobacillus binensis]|uniref:MerR family transcriptional regulator n=1 Tax=Loigolactobacillus binensis TaxID=2559922 RepID=A0ABW3EA28_9LACO|nr:MerR family transcriptional regulator [Loigolactobacillus binensis]
MTYTITEVAAKFGLSAYTIRYYDKAGILPFVRRNQAGNRQFDEVDVDWLRLVCCLKNTGMALKDIKAYSDLARQGSDTGAARQAMLRQHKQAVLQQIADLQANLELIETKIDFYADPQNKALMDHLKELEQQHRA